MPAAASLVWLLASHRFPLPAFDWQLAAATFAHLHWHWVALSLVPMLAHLPRPRSALGSLPQAPEAASLHAEPDVRHARGLHRHHPLRPPRRVRPPLPDRPQRAGSRHLPVRRLGPRTHLRPPHGPAALHLCALPRAVLGPPRRRKTDLGPGRRRQGRRSPGGHHSTGVALPPPLRRAAPPAPDPRPAPPPAQTLGRPENARSTHSSRASSPCAATPPSSWSSSIPSSNGC